MAVLKTLPKLPMTEADRKLITVEYDKTFLLDLHKKALDLLAKNKVENHREPRWERTIGVSLAYIVTSYFYGIGGMWCAGRRAGGPVCTAALSACAGGSRRWWRSSWLRWAWA
jgi:hypothetical protein